MARQPKCTLKGASRDPASPPCPPRLDLCLVEQPGPNVRLHVAGSIKAQQVRPAGRSAWQGVQGLGRHAAFKATLPHAPCISSLATLPAAPTQRFAPTQTGR